MIRTASTPYLLSAIAGPSRQAARSQFSIRLLETAATTPRRAALQDGLSFDDFLNDRASSRVILGKTAPRLPSYLRHEIPIGSSVTAIKNDLRGLNLNTVCEQARCPNLGTCWGGGKAKATATILLGGSVCTRACRFCSIGTSKAPPPLDPLEPEHVADAISRWGVGYITLTSVDRDDLADGGAAHIAETIRKIKQKAPTIRVEMLSPDFAGDMDAVRQVALAGLDVFSHNVETVERCTPFVRDRRAGYRQSLRVLQEAKRATQEAGQTVLTKSSMMLGVGETDHEIKETLDELRALGIDIVYLGQYLKPTKRHMAVDRMVPPEEFQRWKHYAEDLGFLAVESGPLVRSSYKAGESFIELERRAQS